MPNRWPALAGLLVPAAAVAGVLAPFADVDPADGFTFSNSPFTDEAWWLANARNLALFGTFSTDEWNLHLVSPVYSALQAAVLSLAGVDIIHARLAVIAAVTLGCIALAFGLRRPLGALAAVTAAAGFGFSPLVLFYGRLGYIEPLVALALAAGVLTAAMEGRGEGGGRDAWLPGIIAGGALALAIGAKPTALPLVAGILATGVAVGVWRDAWLRRWATGASAVVVVCGALWAVLVLLPQRDSLAVVARILAEQTLPEEAGELLYRVLSYPLSNDRALLYSLPLLAGAAAGATLAWMARRSLPAPTRRLAALCVGWLVVGVLVLMVIPYRPNRYFLPLVPPLAILTAVGAHVWLRRDHVDGLAAVRRRLSALSARTAAALMLCALVAPGIAIHASLMWNGTRALLPLQETVAAALPAGAVVEGAYAPLLAFRAPAVTIVSRPESDVNASDLYTTRGVRWVVVEDGLPPAWASLHAAEWAARRTVTCHVWGRSELCLVNVP